MSNQPMQVAWGAEHTVVFNDAWARHPDLEPHVGAPAHSGENEIDRVLREGEAISVGGFTYAPIFDDSDTVVGVVCTPDAAPDHPEERANLRAKDDFLSLFGHELRNPLSALFTTLQVVARMHPGPEVALMDRAVRHLTRLVDDLLDVSRLNRGKLALHPTRTELASVIDTALAQVESKLAERSTRVFVSVPRTGFELECDPARIAQVLANVIDNASKFSEPGSQVVVEASRTADRARIIVRDHGAGIEPARLACVFEPFQDRTSSTTGLGLGLAIARNLIELHSGTIQLNSVVGTGTECVIELPMDAEAVAAPPPIEKRATRKRVLLVEDNHDTAIALQKALESLGYQVAIAHNGPVALTVARSFQPDVALLDIGLPVMDGWELARRLRELKVATRQLHFIAVTARDQDSDKQRSADAGFADHLVKPIDLTKLERVVENLPD
jgi:CheY-like chemotaxis protein